MKILRGLAIYGMVMGAALLATGEEAEAGPGCEVKIHVINGFNTKIRLTKAQIGSPKNWRTLWEGELAIDRGRKETRTFHTGTSCTDKQGNPRKWNLRYTRKNGKTHVCSGVGKEAKNQLEPGGGCTVSNKSGS